MGSNLYSLPWPGPRYIKVTYKEFSNQTLVISVLDKEKEGLNEN
jgi:hypothetical protein